ncbi:hypothetical protein FH972_015773 [Carpinus fangiana]|uniref:Uncharacterized protein n=1 Tax=Carpinus fangiana TaxID=176857 RepID=A0A5N6RDS8_9ROSI|nr:hypothetical protein FH972_015773 [Carpinus fangiana]
MLLVSAVAPRASPPDPISDNDWQSEEAHSRGVKHDLFELKQTLTRQLWGVASFLAPPVSSEPSTPLHFPQTDASDQSVSSGAEEEPSDHTVSWIGSDIAEISKMPLNEELLEARGLGGAMGITDEVLAFAGNIGMHPETWLDFPLDDEEDLGGMCVSFSMIVFLFQCAPRASNPKITEQFADLTPVG